MEEETRSLCRTDEETHAQEEEEMQKFVDFMKKQGLVMVQQTTDTPKMTVHVTQEQEQCSGPSQKLTKPASGMDKEKRGIETDFIDNNSVVTIYRNAVKPISDQTGSLINQMEQGNKRDSSSSERPLDTSDEVDKLPIGEIEMNRECDINQFISDAR